MFEILALFKDGGIFVGTKVGVTVDIELVFIVADAVDVMMFTRSSRRSELSAVVPLGFTVGRTSPVLMMVVGVTLAFL
jgi:hypothetical protein